MPIATEATYGLCKLKGCRVRFRKKNKRQAFCSKAHKESFYRRGQFPFDRMADEIMKRVATEIAPLRARVAELEAWADLSARLGVPHDDFPICATPALSAAARIAAPKFADPEADEPACIDWAEIDRSRLEAEARYRQAKRGGGAAA